MLPRHQEGEPRLALGRHLQEERKRFSPWTPSLAGSSGRKTRKNQAGGGKCAGLSRVGSACRRWAIPSSLGAVREGALAAAAGRFEAASDLLLKRPCFLPPIYFFLCHCLLSAHKAWVFLIALEIPGHSWKGCIRRLCGVRIIDACRAHREEGEHDILQWSMAKLCRSVYKAAVHWPCYNKPSTILKPRAPRLEERKGQSTITQGFPGGSQMESHGRSTGGTDAHSGKALSICQGREGGLSPEVQIKLHGFA